MAAPENPPKQEQEIKAKRSALSRNYQIFKALYPKLPLVTQIAVSHTLGLSEESKYRDLRSHVVFSVLKSFTEPNNPYAVSKLQARSRPKPLVEGRMWISTYTSPTPPETGARDVIMSAIDGMVQSDSDSPKGEGKHLAMTPDFVDVEAEWTGYRAGVDAKDPLPDASEKEIYDEMMKEVTHPATVMYLHGGGYYLMDPATHRGTVKRLARMTGGRCYSVRYRLSPQAVFPAALLDAFVSYLTLLYPPPGAYHEAVKAEHIVISGDSAGGNLTLSLLQLLLELRRKNVRVQWHGHEREIPLPAGAAGNSPWLDLTHSLVPHGGIKATKYDYLPEPRPSEGWSGGTKPDHIWPADPPRWSFYAEDHLITHPLVSLIGTTAQDWEGCPPIYICTGWEVLGTEDRVFARRLAKAGLPIVFEDYEAMPHCFALVLPKIPESRRCYGAWTGFIKDAVENPSRINTKAVLIKAKTREEEDIQLDDIADITEEQAVAEFRNQKTFKVVPRL